MWQPRWELPLASSRLVVRRPRCDGTWDRCLSSLLRLDVCGAGRSK